MKNTKNIYFANAKSLKAKLLTLDICSQFTNGYIEIQGYYGMRRVSFKEVATNRAEVLTQAIQDNQA